MDFRVSRNRRFTTCTPCNVGMGNQNYANEILTGASGHELQTVDRMTTNLLSRYIVISKRESRQLGNVVLISFHFYTRVIIKNRGKSSCQLLICFLVRVRFIPLHLARDKFKLGRLSFHAQPFFVWCRNEHIVRFSKI